MLTTSWREHTWSQLDQRWDIIVIGGGITGAGIFNMAAQKGLKVVLLEMNDFAFGTSSRSSKLIHGGIRYLKNRQFDVVRESVKERERLIRHSDDLVEPLPFIFPSYQDNARETRMMRVGVVLYDLLAPKWEHRRLESDSVRQFLPVLRDHELVGGVQYSDASVDDSQLVLRVIMDGIRQGGAALNYAGVVGFSRSKSGQVEGVIVRDQTGQLDPPHLELRGNVVINATGPWSDDLRSRINAPARLRRLRGSHLIFPADKLPIQTAVTMVHPRDNRALFAIPWENRIMIGTTDLDHSETEDETRISASEVAYLMEATQYIFPDAAVSEDDIISTFSGLRPVINTGAPTPGEESRAHQIWEEDGLVTVSGGKLTIFQVMAADVLNACRHRLPSEPAFSHKLNPFIHPRPQTQSELNNPTWQMMAGRLGRDVKPFFETASADSLTPIDPLRLLWAEIAWAAKNEAVVHLDDLLLRRVRLGLLLPQGGLNQIQKIRSLSQSQLGWTDEQWEAEVERYHQIWRKNYYLPD